MKADILAVLLGKVRPFRGDDEPSAIGKLPVADVVAVGAMGLAGDEQADRTVHGGIDKAIHHYPADHYDWWRGYLGDASLLDAPGAFGENISTSGLDEQNVFLGDRFRLGSALVEVTQARQPCWKLDHRFQAKGVMAQVVKTRRTGWYYRVLESGQVRAKRSKKAERDSAASFASAATVHARAGAPWICRMAAASRGSLKPRSSPGGALSPSTERSASTISTSTSRDRIRSHPGRSSPASSRTSRTSVASRSAPRR